MVKVVITDFDGVVRHWSDEATRKVEEDCKLPSGTLNAIRFQPELLQPAIEGQIRKEDWISQVHDALKKRFGQGVADHYIEAWAGEQYRIDHGLLTQYRELFPDAKLALATNATTGLHNELRDAGLSHHFDFIFNSSAMGVAKPKKQFFYALLISMGIKAPEALFIDDSLANVLAAKELGMKTVHYTHRSVAVEQLTHLALQASMLEPS